MIILRQRYFSEAGKKKLEERARKKANKNKWLIDNYYDESRADWISDELKKDLQKTHPQYFPKDHPQPWVSLEEQLKDARGALQDRELRHGYFGNPYWTYKSFDDKYRDSFKNSKNPTMTSINLKPELADIYKKSKKDSWTKTRAKDFKRVMKKAAKYRKKIKKV